MLKSYDFEQVCNNFFNLQVNRNDDWDDLLTSFGVDEATANGSLVLKQTYLRYLDPYEKVHFHGEEDDTANDEWADAEVNKQMTICHKYFL